MAQAGSIRVAPAPAAERKQHNTLGLHITAIRKFLTDHPRVISDHLTTSQINRAFVKPESEGTNKPFIDKYIGEKDPETGVPLISQATVFVSHAWKYKFNDVVVSVMEQYASKHPYAYFWFDLFTNNQNEVINKDFDWFSTTFRSSIREIGQVLLVLSPWNDPIPIRRAWCLFEIHNAVIESEVELTVDIPLDEVEELKEGVIQESGCLIQALADIQAEKAEATTQFDREQIFKAIRKLNGGFSQVNQRVKDQLRSWYMNQLELLINRTPEDTTLMRSSAHVMRGFAFYDQSLFHYQNALRIDIELYGKNHINVGDSYHGMAGVYYFKGNHEQALRYYNKSLEIRRECLGDNHVKVADAYNNIGALFNGKSDYNTALHYHYNSLKIKMDTLGENHADVATSYSNIAAVYLDKGDNDKALYYYNKSLQIGLDTLGENHPGVGHNYNSMGVVYKKIGDYDRALSYYNKAVKIRLDTLGENHPAVAHSYYTMAMVYRYAKRDYEKAVDYFTKALTIYKRVHGDSHPNVAECRCNITLLRLQRVFCCCLFL